MKIVSSKYIKSDSEYVQTCIEDYSKDIDKLQNVLNNIKTVWEGTDADSFVEKYQEIIKKLRIYENNFIEYRKYLSQVQEVYEALNENYDKQINTD